jgi:transposase-like protein
MIKKRPCFECEKPSEHNHHVVPQIYGGTKTIPLCHDCHGKAHGLEFKFTELVKAGIERARKNGKQIGRKKVVVDVEEIIRLRISGLSQRKIAERVKCSTGAVQRTLRGFGEVQFKFDL